MLDELKYLETKNEKYPYIYSLNVMSVIQNEYGSLAKWGNLVEPKDGSEANLQALIDFFTEAINDGIDLENGKTKNNRPFVTKRQTGRILAEAGLEKVTTSLKNAVVSNNSEETQNQKNVITTQNPMI
nr:MAG TPA: hypothetical protein [Caudoviricetes sp.]